MCTRPIFDRIHLPKFKITQPEPPTEEEAALDALSRFGEPDTSYTSPWGGYYDPNLRQILSDNAIKDMLMEEDRKFFNTVSFLKDCEEDNAIKALSNIGN